MKQKLLSKVLLLLLALVAVSASVWGETVTYTISAKNTLATSGTAPTGSSATIVETYSTTQQMTSGNSQTLTLTGWEGYTISNITLSMHSNKSAGAGKLSYSTDGSSTFTYIIGTSSSGVNFNDASWNDGWTQYYVDVSKDVDITTTASNFVIKIEATANSIYCQSYEITYSPTVSGDEEATTTTIDASGITNTNRFTGTVAGSLSAIVKDSSDEVIDGATITWSGNNDEVATINATTGAVTLVAAGTVTFTASYAGVENEYQSSTDTYEMTVTNENPNLVTIWSEDFSSYKANDVPSGGTYSYVCQNGNSSTMIYAENSAGGTSPELLINRKGTTNGSFSATIPLNNEYTGTLALSFKNNNAIYVSVSDNLSNSLVSSKKIDGNTSVGNTVEIPRITTSTTYITIVWTNSTSSNVRLDDIVLKGTPAPAAPTFSPAAGEILKGSNVTLSAQDGTTIYYTTDGSEPTESSTEYTAPFAITEACTVRAIAVKGGVSSAVAEAAYTLLKPDMPTFDVAEKTFDEAFDVTITSAAGTTLKYTTDGTDPETNGTAVASNTKILNIPTGASVTVKAVAILDEVVSDVASVTYTYDARPAPTFSLSATSLDLKVNETSSAVTLTTNSDGTVSFSCDDAHVTLTGTGNSRTIKADAAGTYTVNVATAASSNYIAGAGTVTVTVTKKATTMSIETVFTSKDLRYDTEGMIEGTVKYNGATLADAVVTYSSSDESVATVDDEGTITFKKVGTTTITANYAGNDEYEACEGTYELVLEDSTPQETSIDVTTNYKWLGVGSGGSLIDFPKNINCSGVTATISGAGIKTRGDDTYIRLYAKNTLKLTAPTGYYLTQVVFDHKDGSNTVTVDEGTWTQSTHTWTGSAANVTFTIGGSSGNNQINGFTITLAPTITITAAKYATYCSAYDLDFSATGITVYKAKANATSVTLTEISGGIVPANTGVILYKDVDEATTIAVPVTTTDAVVSDNELVGVTTRTQVDATSGGKYNYILSNEGDGIGFYKATDGKYLAANKAYLSTSVDAGVRDFLGFTDEGADGINTIHNSQFTMHNYYDLSGRRVVKPTKGLYIVNGKKVVK